MQMLVSYYQRPLNVMSPFSTTEMAQVRIATKKDFEEYFSLMEKLAHENFWLARAGSDKKKIQKDFEAHKVWLLIFDDTPVGFVEIDTTKGKALQLCYLGILEIFRGQKFGQFLLGQTLIHLGNEFPTKMISLKTCELDHPHAIRLYKKFGFQKVFEKTEEFSKES